MAVRYPCLIVYSYNHILRLLLRGDKLATHFGDSRLDADY